MRSDGWCKKKKYFYNRLKHILKGFHNTNCLFTCCCNIICIIVELMHMLSFAESIPFLYIIHMVALLYTICLFSYILHTYHCWINVLHFICKEHYIYHTLWARMFQHYPVNPSNVLIEWIHPYCCKIYADMFISPFCPFLAAAAI